MVLETIISSMRKKKFFWIHDQNPFFGLILLFLTAVLPNGVSSATYYVSNSQGNDSNIGTSINFSWKTISKVNNFSFQPSDTILFRRGDTWRATLSVPASGSSNNFITYSAYGSGNKPAILGSEPRTSPCDWTNLDANIWETAAPIPADPKTGSEVGNIILVTAKIHLPDTLTGVRVFNNSELKSQGNFWFDPDNKRVRMYSIKNPATAYSSIECAVRIFNIAISQARSFIRIENLALKFAAQYGIQIIDGRNIRIKNCAVCYVGGNTWGKVRAGNGIEFWKGAENCRVEDCIVYEIYDAALTNQWDGSTGPAVQKNIIYKNNIIWNAEWGFEYWNRHPHSLTDSIFFEHNTCINAGGGWGHNQRPDQKTGWHVCIGNNPAKTTNVYIRYNIFANSIKSSGPDDVLYGIVWRDWKDIPDVLTDNNCWFIEDGGIAEAISSKTAWGFKNYSDYIIHAKINDTTFQDKNSVFINPLKENQGKGSSLAIGKNIIERFFRTRSNSRD
jgi:hypothetical protein